MFQEEYIRCSCGHAAHTLKFTFDFDEDENEPNFLFLDLYLEPHFTQFFPDIFNKYFWNDLEFKDKDFWEDFFNRSIIKKLFIVFNYVFLKKDCDRGLFSNTIIDSDDFDSVLKIKKVNKLLNNFLNNEQIFDCKNIILKDNEYISEIENDNYIIQFVYSENNCMECMEDITEIETIIQFKRYKKFTKRLWAGLKYFFGTKSRYGSFDNFSIDKNKVIELKNIFSKFLNILVEKQ